MSTNEIQDARERAATVMLGVRIAAGVIVLGSFGPWARVTAAFVNVSQNGTDVPVGWLVLVAAVALGIMAARGPRITTGLAGTILFLAGAKAVQVLGASNPDTPGIQPSLGWGLVLVLFASTIVLVVTVREWIRSRRA